MLARFLAILTVVCCLGAASARAETLFEQLGARPGLERIVANAADNWTHDPRVAPTFEDTNMDRFKRLLVEQLCHLTQGGCIYTGRDMHEAHKGLHLDTRQFNALVEGLEKAMDQSRIAYSAQNRLLALLAPMYRDVVTK